MRSRRRRRASATTTVVFAIVAVVSIVAGTTADTDFGATATTITLTPIAAFAAVVGRWWILVLPLAWSAVVLVIVRLNDVVTGECSICTEDESWSNYPLLVLVWVVVPMTAAMLVGVALRALARRRSPATEIDL